MKNDEYSVKKNEMSDRTVSNDNQFDYLVAALSFLNPIRNKSPP